MSTVLERKHDILSHFHISVLCLKFPTPFCFSSLLSHPTLDCWRSSQQALTYDAAVGKDWLNNDSTISWVPAEANRLPQGWHAHVSYLLLPGNIQLCSDSPHRSSSDQGSVKGQCPYFLRGMGYLEAILFYVIVTYTSTSLIHTPVRAHTYTFSH